MKIGYLTSLPDHENGREIYQKTINKLLRYGYEVIHELNYSPDEITKLSLEKKQNIYNNNFNRLKNCEAIIADLSYATFDVIYGLSLLINYMKPVIILYEEGKDIKPNPEEIFGKDNSQVIIQTYTKDTLSDTIHHCMKLIQPKVDKRFHILLPAEIVRNLEKISKIKKIAKATYIRQLLEMQLPRELASI